MRQHTTSFALLFLVLYALAPAQAEEEVFSRTRHKAALLTLLSYNPLPAAGRDFACQRAQLYGLCHSFVQEGGYDPARMTAILRIEDPEVEHLALLIRQLDRKREELPRPGALILAGTVALAYTIPSADGLRAAVHTARYSSADPDQPALSRAAYSMIVYALEGKLQKKEELIQVAALNCDDERIAQEIRALPLRELRKLPPETTALGRFCRAVFFWQRAESWEQALAQGRRELRYPETMHFLAILSASWVDLPHLPEDFVWSSLQEKEVRDLCADLHNLAETGILSPVDKKLLAAEPTDSSATCRQQLNGKPVADDDPALAEMDANTKSLAPIPPVVPIASLPALDVQNQLSVNPDRPQGFSRQTPSQPPTPPVLPTFPVQKKSAAAAPKNATYPKQRIVATTATTETEQTPTQPLQPSMPGTPATPALPAGRAGTARLTVTTYTPQSGETTQETDILLPELEPVAPVTPPSCTASVRAHTAPAIVIPADDALHAVNFPLE